MNESQCWCNPSVCYPWLNGVRVNGDLEKQIDLNRVLGSNFEAYIQRVRDANHPVCAP